MEEEGGYNSLVVEEDLCQEGEKGWEAKERRREKGKEA